MYIFDSFFFCMQMKGEFFMKNESSIRRYIVHFWNYLYHLSGNFVISCSKDLLFGRLFLLNESSDLKDFIFYVCIRFFFLVCKWKANFSIKRLSYERPLSQLHVYRTIEYIF